MPGRHDLKIKRGDDKAIKVRRWTDRTKTTRQDLTGRTYIAQIKTDADDTTPVATFTIDDTNAEEGEIILRLSNATTTGIPVGVYHWDLQENSGGIITTLIEGTVTVKKDTSR